MNTTTSILSWLAYRLHLPYLCPCCLRWSLTVKRRHRCTAYHDDELNYLRACADCQRQDDEYFQELWQDYYAGRL